MKHVASIKGVRVNDWNWQKWQKKQWSNQWLLYAPEKKKLPFSTWRKHWKNHALQREGVQRVKCGILIPIRRGSKALLALMRLKILEGKAIIRAFREIVLLNISRSSALIEVNKREKWKAATIQLFMHKATVDLKLLHQCGQPLVRLLL